MRRICIILFLMLYFFIHPVSISAQSDDITLMGSVTPLFYLQDAFSGTVITSNNTSITIQISDIAVETDRILVRFFASEIPDYLTYMIDDDARLYGSYLPVAEIVLEDGTILTPSSASRYSFLEYNDQLIIGGLLVFNCDRTPHTFYFNFNQLPFDEQPLSESFSRAVILKSEGFSAYQSQGFQSVEKNGIEFSLNSSAQTSALTMLQPSVRMIREDEILSKFGWITISDSITGKRYAVTRGSLYGFNLSDDTLFSPAHAYVFAPMTNETPLKISMDHAYVVRTFEPAQKAMIDLSGDNINILFKDNSFYVVVTDIDLDPDEDRIRLYIDTGDVQIADLSFKFKDLNYVINPSVSCGFESDSGSFACDIYFNDISFPSKTLSVEIDAVEYLAEGPWELTWVPVPVDESDNQNKQDDFVNFTYTYENAFQKAQPAEVQSILDSISQLNEELTNEPGWIHESYELDYQFDKKRSRNLIPADLFAQYYTHYISENWYLVGNDRQIDERVSIIRDPDDNAILSAQLQRTDNTIDILHALLSKNNQVRKIAFSCFEDFSNVAESSSVFLSESFCPDLLSGEKCLDFYQSLNGMPNSTNSQRITFAFDANNYLISESISYDQDALQLTKTTLTLEKQGQLPEDIISLLDSIL